jgi:amino acid adenylation domain-containing protein
MSRVHAAPDRTADDVRRFEAGPHANFDLTAPLDAYVRAQAHRSPTAVALSDGRERVTYEEMWRRAVALRAALEARGVGRGDIVGVCAQRSVDLPITLLAIIASGAAYCPLDPEQPVHRLRGMLAQAVPAAVVVAPRFARAIKDATRACSTTELLVSGEDGRLGALPANSCAADVSERYLAPDTRNFAPDDPAYVMFTSGSTGQPKGVIVPHRGIVNRLLWMEKEMGLQEDDIVLQKTAYTFDVSVWEFFWPLIMGARLHLAVPGGHRDPRYLAQCISAERVSVVHFVPSMLSLFLEERLAANCRSLRHVISSGEALPAPLMRRALEILDTAALWNLYGPTEASIDATCWCCRMQPASEPVPIGRPIANVDCLVLDERGERVAIGEVGELCIGGPQVALGYIGQEDLTAERFVRTPLYSGVIYRTGDMARWRPDGLLDYLGRRDTQVKLHGIRVELGEIETAIRGLPGVVDAAVLVRNDDGRGEWLVAYVVFRDAVLDQGALRSHLAQSLPKYMIPTLVVPLTRLPTTASGKLDRKALPSPTGAEPI